MSLSSLWHITCNIKDNSKGSQNMKRQSITMAVSYTALVAVILFSGDSKAEAESPNDSQTHESIEVNIDEAQKWTDDKILITVKK